MIPVSFPALAATVLAGVLAATPSASAEKVGKKNNPPPTPSPPGTWSKPVEGLRIRLLSAKEKYRVGESLVLTLEVQNVSKGPLLLETPQVMPVISYPGSNPFGKGTFPWVITCEVPNAATCILWSRRQALRSASDLNRLAPGETLRLRIDTLPMNKEFEADRIRKAGEPVRVQAHFVGTNFPAVYLLRTTFRRGDKEAIRDDGTGPRHWTGKLLEAPVVRIEVIK